MKKQLVEKVVSLYNRIDGLDYQLTQVTYNFKIRNNLVASYENHVFSWKNVDDLKVTLEEYQAQVIINVQTDIDRLWKELEDL